MEKSLLIFKPDSALIIDFFKKVTLLLEQRQLKVVKRGCFTMTKDQVFGIWHTRCLDPMIYEIMLRAYENKEMIFWVVEGEMAIIKCLEIKKTIRSQFSLSFIKNCIHCPNDKKEYDSNMRCIYNIEKYIKPELYYDLRDKMILSKRLISEDDIQKCANFFADAEESSYKKLYQKKESYQVTLYRDNLHWLTEYAVILYNIIIKNTLCEAYLYAMATIEYEKAPVFFSDDFKQAKETYNQLKKEGLLVSIQEGTDIAMQVFS